MCAQLEQQSLKCWIAPRDIKPGEEYAAGIVRGIDNCKCMVIVFSEASNASKHVLREVERAVGSGAVVIPFRIEDTMPTDSMDYFLKVAHWLDAKDMKLDEAIAQLSQTVAAILEQPIEKTTTKVQSDLNKAQPKSSLLKYAFPAVLTAVVASGIFWFTSDTTTDEKTDVQSVKTETRSKTPLTIEQQKKQRLAKLVGQNKELLSDASLANVNSTLDISMQLPNRELKLKAWVEPERTQFMQGDKVQFKANLSQDAYLAVYVHSMDGSTYLIYPNHQEAPVKIIKNQVFTVGSGKAFELEIAEPFGVDVIQFIATNNQDEFKHLLSKHTPLQGMNIAMANRSDVVKEMKGIKRKGIKVVASQKSKNTAISNAWGEAVILLNTKEKQ